MKRKQTLAMLLAGALLISTCMGCSSTTSTSTTTEEIPTTQEAPPPEESAAPDSVIYVDSQAAGNCDGTSWADAYQELFTALDNAEAGDEIWVAAGTYYPTDDGDASVSFNMKDDVSVYGGFDGTETNREARDWETNVTILSGDIGEKNFSDDNTLKVVIAANNTLDGFTITAGQGMAVSDDGVTAGGMNGEEMPDESTGEYGQAVGYMTEDLITLGDAQSSIFGNGIIIWNVAPTIANCNIVENYGGKGAGVYIIGRAESGELPTFVNCSISYNYGYGRGGGISIDMDCQAYFIDCVFDSNDCEAGKGGAIYNDALASPLFENCLFINNTAESGGAMGNDGASCPVFSNCTFYNNTATEEGAALYQGSGPFNDPVMINSIIYDNYCDQGEISIYDWAMSSPMISYSIVQYGYEGESILDVDPQFNDPDNMDFTYASTSPALTASDTGEAIGFDASLLGTRSDAEIEEIKTYLLSLVYEQEVDLLDLSNPVTAEEATHIGSVVYVDVDATGADDGSSWADAYTSITEAINYAGAAAELNDTTIEVWVAEGTYYTGTERDDYIFLRENVNVYGGFDGTENELSQRDYESNVTILSGEIGDISTTTDNSFHVVVGADYAILDGFTITGGYADGADGNGYNRYGGGMLNYLGGFRQFPMIDYTIGFDVVVNNCIFTDNYAETGGATYTFHGGNPEYNNCTFVENTAMYGAASADVAGTNAIYTDCEFLNNYAIYKGGATFTDYGSMSLFYGCTFEGNESGTAGGAIYVLDRASQEINNDMSFYLIDETWSVSTDIYSTVYLEDCILTGNTAGSNGGAMYVYEASFAKLVNCMIENNTSVDAAVVANNEATVILQDTTFDNNSPEDIIDQQLSQVIYE